MPCIKAWANNLGGINYPLLSDFWPHGEVALKYGVFRPHEGRSERALFVIDKQGVIQYIDIHDIDEQPDNETARRQLRRGERHSFLVPNDQQRPPLPATPVLHN